MAPILQTAASTHPAHARSTVNRVCRGAALVAACAAIWLAPLPAGVAPKAWHLFAIFLATILGLILQPVPMGAIVLIGITVTTLTGTLTINDALNGYMNSTVWLIVAAFLFAKAFSKTGLGRRIAFLFIRAFGHRTLGLAYALGLTDLVLAPGIPSGAARTGGVLFPVVKSLALTYGSEPGPTAGRIGTFLMLSAYQVHAVTCAMFLTSMVRRPGRDGRDARQTRPDAVVLRLRRPAGEGVSLAARARHSGAGLHVLALLFRQPGRPHRGLLRPLPDGSGGGRRPAYFAALTFAFFSSLCVSLTHYGGGPSPVYWGAGYSDVKTWWRVGFVVSLMYLVVWMGIGPSGGSCWGCSSLFRPARRSGL